MSSAGEEIVSAFDLRNAIAHNGSSITRSGSVSVVTPAQQWSYAVGFPLRRSVPSHRATHDLLLVRLEGLVAKGRIGALLVADDLRTVVSTVVAKTANPEGTTIELIADPPPRSGWLILRNDDSLGPTEFEVQSIRAFRLPRDAYDRGNVRIVAAESKSGLLSTFSIVGFGQSGGSKEGPILKALRRKWEEVPAGLNDRRSTTDLLHLSDNDLQTFWTRIHQETTTGDGFAARGWYHELYKDVLRGRRVLDVGSGLGIDGLTFARNGAAVTFVDIVESNLRVIQRLCGIWGLKNAQFHYLNDLQSLDTLPNDFEVIWCQGSMINAPFSFARREAEALLRHLPVGGRWIELAYPRERWQREGKPPFSEWGNMTDGEGTPWMEWYDLDRIQARFEPVEFEVVLQFNFHQDDFNWFDLIRRK